MSAPRPALLPLLRSENQLRLLSTLLLSPRRGFTVGELVASTGIPQPSVSREVKNLLATSLLSVTVERGRRVIRANTESPIFPELASLILKTAGPAAVLKEALEGIDGIDAAYIFGSWARRYCGEPGTEPRDIDLLVVGRPDVDLVRRRADEATTALGRDVNVIVLTADEWSGAATGFVHQIRTAPLVELDVIGDGNPDTDRGAVS